MNANDAVNGAVAEDATNDAAAVAVADTDTAVVDEAAAEAEVLTSESTSTAATDAPDASVPEPRPAPPSDTDGETERGKSKKPRRAVRAKSTGGTKALVVWREGRLHYADENVLVIDLDEAASTDVDVHDVVDRLAELRDAVESPGRAETVAALGEIIQEKALS